MTAVRETNAGEAAERERFPFRFFAVTFAWSWLIWLPLVLAGMGIISRKGPAARSTVPWIALGIFGPSGGAFPCPRTLRGQAAVRDFRADFWIFVSAGGGARAPCWYSAKPPGSAWSCRSRGGAATGDAPTLVGVFLPYWC